MRKGLVLMNTSNQDTVNVVTSRINWLARTSIGFPGGNYVELQMNFAVLNWNLAVAAISLMALFQRNQYKEFWNLKGCTYVTYIVNRAKAFN